ncbi:unnamed protein product [Nesidiocoris tenuis]|uniref:Ig-like domain-containing protein n=1 Tax=Nesidiocoris tenuis TaxID=355587 RepID=A0A6H5H881_9HEMI|nr:unnamed protein product [Nesidiocoris tenuis]
MEILYWSSAQVISRIMHGKSRIGNSWPRGRKGGRSDLVKGPTESGSAYQQGRGSLTNSCGSAADARPEKPADVYALSRSVGQRIAASPRYPAKYSTRNMKYRVLQFNATGGGHLDVSTVRRRESVRCTSRKSEEQLNCLSSAVELRYGRVPGTMEERQAANRFLTGGPQGLLAPIRRPCVNITAICKAFRHNWDAVNPESGEVDVVAPPLTGGLVKLYRDRGMTKGCIIGPLTPIRPGWSVSPALFKENYITVILLPAGYGTIKRGSSVCVQYLCPQGNKRKIETTKELSDGLKLIDVKIDKHVVMGRGTTLECLFDMESEPLYSVKWYKDGHEFFRFVPKEVPPSQHFSVPGVHVDANATLLRGPHTRRDASGLEVTTLGLEFRVERRHYRKGDMKLKCLASIATVYWNSNEESVEGDRPQRPPALEVKDNLPYPSRADRVLVGGRLMMKKRTRRRDCRNTVKDKKRRIREGREWGGGAC